MKKSLIALALVSAFAAPVIAEEASPLSFNVGVVSDYLFRGISQTHGKPAVQAGVDYAHSSGLYIGAWASSISWVKDWTGSGSVEIDVYGGYKNTVGDFSYDVGYITYNYPGHGGNNPTFLANPNTQEVYAAVGYKWLTAKYSVATSKNFVGWYGGPGYDQNTRGSGYLELNANYDMGDGWALTGHIGHQKVKGSVVTAAAYDASYTDWKLGVTKDVGFGVVGLAYSDTNADGSCSNPLPATGASAYCWGTGGQSSTNTGPTGNFKNVARGTAVLSFLKTF